MFTGVICAGLSFLTMTLCGLILTVVTSVSAPGFVSSVLSFGITLLEWAVCIFTMLAELSLFIFGSLIDIVNFIIDMYKLVAPHVSSVGEIFQAVLRCVWGEVNYIRVEVWNFIMYKTETVLGLWALLLVTLWTYTGWRRSPNVLENRNNTDAGYQDETQQRVNINTNNTEERHAQNINVRRRNVRRLYPDLSQIDDTIFDRYNAISEQSEVNSEPSEFNVHVRPTSEPSVTRDNVDNDSNLCAVCLARQRGVAVFPCGHTHMCLACTRDVMRARRRCPICQTDIEEYRVVYL